MAKIIHTGDIHLDSPFSALSPEDAKRKRASLRTTVSNIIDIASSENVDAVIFAGDLFDTYPIYAETAEKLISDFSRTKIPIFIIPGNHDPYTADSPYRTLKFPENVHIFTSASLDAFELHDIKLRIFGAAYTAFGSDDRILDGFKVPNDDFINIVILHSEIDCARKYMPVSVDEISSSGADYIALAHIHKPTNMLNAGRTHYAYCGVPEARDFGEAYDTGVCIVDITKDSVNFRRQIVSDVRYREITLNTSANSDIISELPPPAPCEHLRLTLIGECESLDTDKLYTELSPQYTELIIEDKTHAPRNIWQGIGEDTLRGIYLRKMKAMLDSCDNEYEKQKLLLAAKLGIDAIENRDM